MAEYIEREVALSKPEILTIHTKEFGKIDVVPVEYIADLPAANVELAVHGEWIMLGMRPVGTKNTHYCSVCSGHGNDEMSHCPSCGAKMEEAR